MPTRKPSPAQRRRLVSFRERLVADLDAIESDLLALIGVSEIRNVDPNRYAGGSGVAFVGFPQWGWASSDDDLLRRRRALTLAYEAWWSRFQTLFGGVQPETRKAIKQADSLLRGWVERKSNRSVPSTIEAAKVKASDNVAKLRAALELLASGGYDGMIAVPDTGALLAQPDLARYSAALGVDELRIVVPTMVVSELDELKDRGKTPELREQAASVIRRFKGLRERGDITAGAPVTASISLTMETREPSFEHLPAHLDPKVPDDRILASTLAIQARFPSATVVLVARDLNIQNKAHVLGLPYAEPPSVPESLE